jgi:hypothetical protein
MFNKKLDIGMLLALTGMPLVAIGILIAMLLPLVQWIRDSLR